MRLQLVLLTFLSVISGCGYLRIDPDHVLLRSDVITSLEQEKEILSRAHAGWTDDGRIRVVYLQGTPYEIGYQQGVLLRSEIQDNLGYLYKAAVSTFHSEEIFAEAYERMRPFIPQQYVDEMQGLAHGSRLPLHVVHAIHALPEMTEWGGKKRLKDTVQLMMDGKLGTSCSNICAGKEVTADGKMYTVRILDWGLNKISKLHQYPLLTVVKPDRGNSYVNITWVGFLGAISGINSEGITLGEMGYGNPDNETLHGKPMPFLLRDVLQYAKNLKDVRRIIKESTPTNSFAFLMSDGKTGDSELYVRDPSRFLVFKPGQKLDDGKNVLPAIANVNYAGHYPDLMHQGLTTNLKQITPEFLMQDFIPKVAMRSNFQNVIYDPKDLSFWVSYAPAPGMRAAEAPYTRFEFKP